MKPTYGVTIKRDEARDYVLIQVFTKPGITSNRLYNATTLDIHDVEEALYHWRNSGYIRCVNKRWFIVNHDDSLKACMSESVKAQVEALKKAI